MEIIKSLNNKLSILCTGDIEKNIIIDWSGGTIESIKQDIKEEIKEYMLSENQRKSYLDWWYIKKSGKVEKLF